MELDDLTALHACLCDHPLRLQVNEPLPHVLMKVSVVGLKDYRSPTTVSYGYVTPTHLRFPAMHVHICNGKDVCRFISATAESESPHFQFRNHYPADCNLLFMLCSIRAIMCSMKDSGSDSQYDAGSAGNQKDVSSRPFGALTAGNISELCPS